MVKQRKKTTSKVTAILLALMMAVVFMPTFAFAAEGDGTGAEPINVFFTISDEGAIATANDGSLMAWKEVSVKDLDGSGDFSFDEALVAVHEQYNSAEGYEINGNWVSKVWGKTSDPGFSFLKNGVAGDVVTAEKVNDGDYLVASINQDGLLYSDWATNFNKNDTSVNLGSTLSLTLKGYAAMSKDDPVSLKGMSVGYLDNGTFKELGTTNNSGIARIKFDNPGIYVVTAQGPMNEEYAFDEEDPYAFLAKTARDKDGTPIFGRTDWSTGTETYYVGYTVADYENGPYPLDEIQWMEYDPSYDPDEDGEDPDLFYADTFDAGHLLYSAKITHCPTIAPCCIVRVPAKPVTVTMTVNNKGVLAKTKDGEAMVEQEVTVLDADKDGKLTVDEALLAAHKKYDAEDGYATQLSDRGLLVTRLWSVDTTNALFMVNGKNIPTGVGADEVAAGDDLYVSVNADDVHYADWKTQFDKTALKANIGEKVAVNVTGRLGMAYTEEQLKEIPLEGIQLGLWKDGAFEPIEGAVTDAEGNAEVSFAEAGPCILTAQGTVKSNVAVDWDPVTFEPTAFEEADCPIMAPYCFVSVNADPVEVTVTISDKGVLASDKDGNAMAERPVAVADLNSDGKLTVDEVMVAAHDEYFEGGAEAGWAATSYATKLWGNETGNTLFYVNDEGIPTGVSVDEVAAGDSVYASVNQDTTYYADWYAKFDQKKMIATTTKKAAVKLRGHLGMAYEEADKAFVPLNNVELGLWKNGAFEALEGVKTSYGEAELEFTEPGEYLLSAQGTVEGVVTDFNLMDLGNNTLIFGTLDWSTYASNVAYTDKDYGNGPYPLEDVKYIDFNEWKALSEAESAKYHVLHSNQLITQCPIMAPYCIVTVIDGAPVDAMDAAIDALPAEDEIALTDKEAIEAAAAQYEALSDDEKAAVSEAKKDALKIAQLKLALLEKEAELATAQQDSDTTKEELKQKEKELLELQKKLVKATAIEKVKVKAGKKKATVTWKADKETFDGYQITYKAKRVKAKTVTITKNTTAKSVIKKLKKGKIYTFKVRGYKTIDGVKIVGKWSAAKKAKIK